MTPTRANPFQSLDRLLTTGRLQATPAVVPGVLCGVLRKPGQRAAFAVQLAKGERIFLRGEARSLNSPADIEVSVTDRTGREVRRAVPLPLGVQVLAAANEEAIAVALACGASFVRVEGFVFAHVADEGLIEADAGPLLRYRAAVGAEHIRVFADIKKKHSSHAITADIDTVETAHAAEFALADGVIVTGTSTGRAADPAEVNAVVAAVGVPVFVGSGITPDNIATFAAADGLIVGSSVKQQGDWRLPLDATATKRLADAFHAAHSQR
jgi:membrane complex biogenesis BtpA family protein